MNVRLSRRDEQEDDAFRARLAPLASEVLPPQSPPGTQRRILSKGAVLAAATAGIGLAVIATIFLIDPWHWIDRAVAPPPSGQAPIIAAPPAPPPKEIAAVQPPDPPTARPPPGPTRPATADAIEPTREMVDLLVRRGETALADGDIIAARLLFERAATLGSATAATSAGKTYDVEFLSRVGARGIRPDQTAAASWFRKAAALGDPEGRARLARIEGRSAR